MEPPGQIHKHWICFDLALSKVGVSLFDDGAHAQCHSLLLTVKSPFHLAQNARPDIASLLSPTSGRKWFVPIFVMQFCCNLGVSGDAPCRAKAAVFAMM